MAALVELLGPSLVATGDGKIKRFTTLATQEALAGKTAIGLVFAADWCARTPLRRACGLRAGR
jgi:hypothetical protein